MTVRNEDLKIGQVISVDGASIIIEAFKLSVKIDSEEDEVTHITVGSFINCGGDHGDVLCVVTRVWQELVDKVDLINKAQRVLTDIKKIELVVVGTISAGFRRGVDHLPPVGSMAYFISGASFDALLNASLGDDSKEKLFSIGRRVGTGSGLALLDLDKFFGRHAAILGTTGSGKSYTVASLAQAVLRSYARPRIVIFDIHNEYGPAFQGDLSERSNCIGWADFILPFWMLSFEEFSDVFTGGRLGSVQRAVLSEFLLSARKLSEENDDPKVTVDSPIPFLWDKFILDIEAYINSLTQSKQGSLPEMLDKMKARRRDPRFAFLFRENTDQEALINFFKKLFGLGDSDSHVTVVDLSGLPTEVRATAIGILCRLFFDYRYWDTNPENLPIAIVLEEAHSYIPAETDSRYTLAIESIEKIAKEGRKYGLSLVVVSQRPANVSSTILSQCGTFIALRLTSDIDQARVLRLLPDTLGNQGSLLGSLRDGEAVVSGDGVTLPGRVSFSMPNPKPGSSDIKFHKSWNMGPPEKYSVADVVSRWLNQQRG